MLNRLKGLCREMRSKASGTILYPVLYKKLTKCFVFAGLLIYSGKKTKRLPSCIIFIVLYSPYYYNTPNLRPSPPNHSPDSLAFAFPGPDAEFPV